MNSEGVEMFNNVGLACLIISVVLGILGYVLKLRRFFHYGPDSALRYLLLSIAIGLALYIPTAMYLADSWPYSRRDPTVMFPAGIVTSILLLVNGTTRPFMLHGMKKAKKNLFSMLGALLYTFTLFIIVAFAGSFLICMYNTFKVVQFFAFDFNDRKLQASANKASENFEDDNLDN